MTEETTTTSTNTGATETKTADTFVPAWKIKSDELKAKASDDEQVVYRSDQYNDCLPVLMPKSSVITYPFIAEEPVGFIAPKYNWNAIGRGWIETASIAQAKEIEMLKANVADLKETAEDVTKQQATDKTKSTQVMQMFQMTTKQIGAIDTKLDAVLDKLNTQSATTPDTPVTSTTTPTEGGNQ